MNPKVRKRNAEFVNVRKWVRKYWSKTREKFVNGLRTFCPFTNIYELACFVYELWVSFTNLRVLFTNSGFHLRTCVFRLRTLVLVYELFVYELWLYLRVRNWTVYFFWFSNFGVYWKIVGAIDKHRVLIDEFAGWRAWGKNTELLRTFWTRKIDNLRQFKRSSISKNTLSTSLWENRWTWGRTITIRTYWTRWQSQSWKHDRDLLSKKSAHSLTNLRCYKGTFRSSCAADISFRNTKK